MWVTKLLISPVKKRIFCPKTTQFGPKLAFLSIAGSFGALLVGWLVVVARAVSRKTPIYFIDSFFCMKISGNTKIFGLVHHIECYTIFTFIVAHALTALRWYSNSLAIDSWQGKLGSFDFHLCPHLLRKESSAQHCQSCQQRSQLLSGWCWHP